jgi:hypothetical protein
MNRKTALSVLGLLLVAPSLGAAGIQLIWATSEASYYAQLAFMAGVMALCFLYARVGKNKSLVALILIGSTAGAVAPIELTLSSALYADQGAAPREGDVVAYETSHAGTSRAILFLLHGTLWGAGGLSLFFARKRPSEP